ncbi:MAG TPA: ABC transporter substrate-binding protein [Candidatus Korarchaeota archaeon]|nr:ABC transporter substrate-binding protein [Candidatus Korarchaeota archaeon]
MKKEFMAALLLAVFFVGFGAGFVTRKPGPTPTETPGPMPPQAVGLSGEILIGALEDLSGALTTYGEDIKAAYEVAEKDVNDFLKKAGAKWHIKLIHEDTASTPEVALEKFESLVGKGVKIVLGPMMSPACASIRSYAEAHNVIFISPSSTAVELSIPGDNLFRFCAIDDLQGPAIASTVFSSGITHLVSCYLDNDWGAGLDKSTCDKFESLGGTVIEHISWSPETIEFSPIAEEIDAAVKNALNSGLSYDKIGVLLISYRQVLSIFEVASEYPDLSKVRWFGTDGTVMIPELADIEGHPTETEFALKTNFTSTMFKIPMTRAYWHVHDEIVKKLGREPTIYAYDAYDSVWIVALALSVVNEYDAMKVKEILPKIADIYVGASGDIMLNENGDLSIADYSLWRPIATADGYEWTEVGVYYAAEDRIEWKQGFEP